MMAWGLAWNGNTGACVPKPKTGHLLSSAVSLDLPWSFSRSYFLGHSQSQADGHSCWGTKWDTCLLTSSTAPHPRAELGGSLRPGQRRGLQSGGSGEIPSPSCVQCYPQTPPSKMHTQEIQLLQLST